MPGHSNGCMTALAMAAEYSETPAVVCYHAGTIITGFGEDYTTNGPLPIWMVSGKLNPYEGFSQPTPSVVLGDWSSADTLDYLVAKNGCSGNEAEVLTNDAGAIVWSIARGVGCGAGFEIASLDAPGHCVFKDFFDPRYGGSPTPVDTNAVAWEFKTQTKKVKDAKKGK